MGGGDKTGAMEWKKSDCDGSGGNQIRWEQWEYGMEEEISFGNFEIVGLKREGVGGGGNVPKHLRFPMHFLFVGKHELQYSEIINKSKQIIKELVIPGKFGSSFSFF